MMYCYECGGTYREKSDRLEVVDPYVGTIVVQGVPYYVCDKCDDILYSEEMSRAIETERNKLMQELLNQFPIDDYISATETTSILGISRQALHKNRRINHGFIYKTTISGITLYLRQSVLQFKKTGDGRFPLYLGGYNPLAQYVEETVPMRWTHPYESQQEAAKPTHKPVFRETYSTSLVEKNYVN